MSGEQNDKWVVGVALGLLGSIAINTGNNIQSLGLKQLKEKKSIEKKVQVQDCKDTVDERKSNKRGTINNSHRKKSSLLINSFYNRSRTVPIRNDVNNGTESTNSLDNIVATSVSDTSTIAKNLSPTKSTTWILGTVVFVTGSLLNFASYAFAAQSMLASLESIQFVTNLLFGKFMIGSKVTRQMYIGTGLTVSGTVVAVQFSSKKTLDLSTSDIKTLYKNPAYIAYLCLMMTALLVLYLVYITLKKRKQQEDPVKYTDVSMPLIYAVWSALFGTQSVVQAKILAELLAVHSAGQEDIFRSGFTYTTIIVWIVTVGVWLKRLNDALSIFDPLFIIPLLQCSFIFFAIVSGGIFFQEFNEFTGGQWIGFSFGVVIMFSGLVLLTPHSTDDNKDEGLPKDVVDLLLSCNNSNEINISRPPLTPRSSPRNSNENVTSHEDNLGIENDLLGITQNEIPNLFPTYPNTQPFHSPITSKPDYRQKSLVPHPKDEICSRISCKESKHIRKLRNSFNIRYTFTEKNMIESVKEIVNESKKILSSPNGTAVLTTAMSIAAEDRKHEIDATRERRQEQINKICSLVEKVSSSISVTDENGSPMPDLIHSLRTGGLDEDEELNRVLDGLKFNLNTLRETMVDKGHKFYEEEDLKIKNKNNSMNIPGYPSLVD